MNMLLTLNDAETAAYNAIAEPLRTRITREIKVKSQELTFNLISGFHLIAGFKAEIRAGPMKRDGQLTSIQLIKQEAVKLELILEEKKKKSAIGTNGNGNGTKSVLINQIEDNEANEIDAIRKGGYKGQNYNPNHQGNRSSGNNTNKCTFCHKPGHQVEKCFTKFPALRNQSNQSSSGANDNNQRASNGQRKHCKFCNKDGHTEDKCFALEKAEKKLKAAKSRINEIQEEENSSNQSKN